MIGPQVSFDHPSVEAAVLFGSHARGDSDMQSDVDVAVFANAIDIETLSKIKTELDCSLSPTLTLSLYSTKTAEVLAREGSLFLWHLNLEGKVLFDRNSWLYSLFSRLEPYGRNKALHDLRTFKRILKDVRHSLECGKTTALFEAATIYAILRNLGMIYSHATGVPCFGRLKPIACLAEGMGQRFPFFQSEISTLQAMRLAYTRLPETFIMTPETDWCLAISSRTATVLDFVKEVIHAAEP